MRTVALHSSTVTPVVFYGQQSLVNDCQALNGMTYSAVGFMLLACSSNMEPNDYLSFVFKCASLAMREEADLNQPNCWDGVFFLAARMAATLSEDAAYALEYSDEYQLLSFESRVAHMTKFLTHIKGWIYEDSVNVPQDFQRHVFQKYEVDCIEEWVEKIRLSTDEGKFIREVLLVMPIQNQTAIYSFHPQYPLYVQEHEDDQRILCHEGVCSQVQACLISFSRFYRASVHFKIDFSGWLQRRIAGFTSSDYDAVIRGFFAFRERSQRATT